MLHPAIARNLAEVVVRRLVGEIAEADVRQAIAEHIKQARRNFKARQIFAPLFRTAAPYERKFRTMLKAHWNEERRIIIANLRKTKKYYVVGKPGPKPDDFLVDSIIYPSEIFADRLDDKAAEILMALILAQGDRILDSLSIDIAFDVENPYLQAWLKEHTFKFSSRLEAVNIEMLRAELAEGIKAGESIPQLTKRINETYANWNRYRSEMIARTETLRASNYAAVESYRQSGVVKKKEWVVWKDDLTCPWCLAMEGSIVELDTPFFNEGDEYAITIDDKTRVMNLNYETVQAPPLHPSCRCAIGPWVED